jgi:hypothetical protein
MPRALDCFAPAIENAREAGVAKLVDARDLKSLGLGCAGSIPAARTIILSGIMGKQKGRGP